MANKTLTDLIAETRQRANMENTQFVTDAEIISRIQGAQGELYDIIIESDETYYQAQASFALTSAPPTGTSAATIDPLVTNTATTNQINLPTNFYRMYGLDVTGAPSPIAVRRFNFAERNNQAFLHYNLMGSLLEVMPYQRAGNTYTFYYTPVPVYLVNGTDALDAIQNPFWEFIPVSAAAQLLIKEESDASPLLARKSELAGRISAVTGGRDDEPDQIPDVTQRTGNRWNYDWWP